MKLPFLVEACFHIFSLLSSQVIMPLCPLPPSTSTKYKKNTFGKSKNILCWIIYFVMMFLEGN